jgi:hypothetical protein
MRTIIAKFPGNCRECGKGIHRGQTIKFYGRGHATHANCLAPDGVETPGEIAARTVAPCWICADPNGKFRNMGAGAPVWCDACFEKEKAKTFTAGNVRFNRYAGYTRFASGAEVFTNPRGRCEDAPCCGCCS